MKNCYAQFKYLLAVYELSKGDKKVKSVDIAKRLDVSRPSVSKTLKCLSKNGFVDDDFSNEVVLTESGKAVGKELFNNYRYALLFFRKVLKLDDEQADEQALTFIATFPEATVERLSQTMKNTIERQRAIRHAKQDQ
ncbi:MAG: metal-dependent transcriptional regulator [Ruminococcus sp.]|nr:metal-dependent transcriptional regulator [Ruminococcus sp.]